MSEHCWSIGDNSYGQQANGSTKNDDILCIIKTLPNKASIKSINTGNTGSIMIIFSDCTAIVFGCNNKGQLGISDDIIKIIIYYWNNFNFMSTDITNLIILFVDTIKYYQNQLLPINFNYCKIKYISNNTISNHRFIISKHNNELYGFGNNSCCQIENTNTKMINKPCKIDYFGKHNITLKEISCGYEFTIFLDDKGKLFCCGQSSMGCLGLGLERVYTVGIERIDTVNTDIIMTHIATGKHHCLAIDSNNGLYTFGWNCNGQIASFAMKEFIPKRLQLFIDTKVKSKKICCGAYHSIVLDTKGDVYCFGANYYNQCGNGHDDDIHQPSWNVVLREFEIVGIKVGADHNVAVVKHTTNDETLHYYLWGLNDYNQCLVYKDDQKSVQIPTRYDSAQDIDDKKYKIISIYVGDKQTMIITESLS